MGKGCPELDILQERAELDKNTDIPLALTKNLNKDLKNYCCNIKKFIRYYI